MKILNMMSHVLSEASENVQKYRKEKNEELVSYWTEVHRALVYACRDIGECNLKKNLGRYKK